VYFGEPPTLNIVADSDEAMQNVEILLYSSESLL